MFAHFQGKTNLLREGQGGRLRVKGPGLMPFEVDTCKKPGKIKKDWLRPVSRPFELMCLSSVSALCVRRN